MIPQNSLPTHRPVGRLFKCLVRKICGRFAFTKRYPKWVTKLTKGARKFSTKILINRKMNLSATVNYGRRYFEMRWESEISQSNSQNNWFSMLAEISEIRLGTKCWRRKFMLLVEEISRAECDVMVFHVSAAKLIWRSAILVMNISKRYLMGMFCMFPSGFYLELGIKILKVWLCENAVAILQL